MKSTLHFEDLNEDCGFYYRQGKKILTQQSDFQKIELLESNLFGKVLKLDNITQVGIKGEKFYHEPMAHLPLLAHPQPKKVLVIGGGDGGINREVLKYKSVKSLMHVDLDERVVEVCREHLPEVSQGCWEDPRAELVIKDGRAFLLDNQKSFDVVIMDMTDPFGPSAKLYTREFFTLVKKSLKNKKSLFCMHSESPITRPEAFSAIHSTLNKVFKKVCPWYIPVQMYGAYWSFAVCSASISLSHYTAKAINRKIKKFNLDHLETISGETYLAFQTEMPVIKNLRKNKSAKIITDADHRFPDEKNLRCYYK